MRRSGILILIPLILALNVGASDWPTYRSDAARSGYTPETLPADLHLQWTYQSAHAPQPAWTSPDSRMPFDYAYNPVIAGDLLYFGSSADCKVYALDAEFGKERWSFFTDAPVRFAPTVWKNRVYVVSDDGRLYCLSAQDGRVIWKKRGGPDSRMLLGNQRMISRWPARGGPAIADGILYFGAGIWPSEGIYLYALDARTGKERWCNDSSGGIEMDQPHPTARAKSGVSAQGYFVVAGDRLIIPTGRAVPAAFDRNSGDLLYFHLQRFRDHGGSQITACSDFFFNGKYVYSAKDGGQVAKLPGSQVVITPDSVILAGSNRVGEYIWVNTEKADRRGHKTSVRTLKKQWAIDTENCGAALIAAGNTIVCGAENRVCLIDRQSKNIIWTAPVEGQPYGLAVADGRLYVGTNRGLIYCFGSTEVKRPAVLHTKINPAPYGKNEASAKVAETILKKANITKGYCLDLSCGDGSLAYELAKRSDFQIYAIDSDPKNVALARQRLDAAGLYGIRVTIHQGDPNRANYPDYFADLIVSGRSVISGKGAVSENEFFRMQRPYGGIACIGKADALTITRRGPLKGATSWTHQYADPANTCCSNDKIAQGPLGMLWFQDTDQLTPNRHGRGPAPLYLNGRIFIMGVNSLRATNAYNGCVLWEYPLPGIEKAYDQEHLMGAAGTGSVFCVTEDGVYVRVKNRCLCLDPTTGEKLREFEAPLHPDGKTGTWGYIACSGNTLLGSLCNEKHIVGYRFLKSDMRGLYTESTTLFAVDAHSGKKKWVYQAEHSIRHNAIAIGNGIVYLIDRPIAVFDRFNRNEGPKNRVQPLGELIALDAETGKIRWRDKKDIYGTLLALSTKHDVLLMAYQATRFRIPSEFGGRMAAFRASTGERLWDIQADYASRPIINDDTIYAQPGAWRLLTGEPTGFHFTRSYGCGTISGSKNLLVFRSATIGYIDLTKSNETQNYGGTRPGCWINALPAGGLVLVPNAWSRCTCSYLLRADLALQNQ